MTRAPWTADHDLDEERFATALERRFPEFYRPTVQALVHGWDYLTYRVDDDWVFKVPKRADVVSRMRQEVSLLTALPPMPASIPRPAFHGVASTDVPYPFFGYPYLDGVNAREAGIDPAHVLPAALAFLDALHTITPPFAVEGWANGSWPQRLERLVRIRSERPQFAPALEWLAAHEPVGTRKTLLHNDLGPEHLLLHPETHELVAVLDWADASRGDPAQDMMSLVLWAPEATARAHRARQGDEEALTRASAHALVSGLQILDDHLRWDSENTETWTATLERVQEAVLAGC